MKVSTIAGTRLNAGLDVVDRAIAVENKWRAQRYGAKGGTFVTRSGAIAVAEMLDRVLERIAADAKALACSWNAAGRSLPRARQPTRS